jgi:hypothetical protein
MKRFKNLLPIYYFLAFVAINGCNGGDEPCDGKSCANNEVMDAVSCACIVVETAPCAGKTCVAGEILNAVDCNCVSTSVCDGKTCPAGELLDAITCNCVPQSNEVNVSENITTDTKWTADKIYILTTRVAVESGATLMIDPGTIIKGEAGAEANATALLIARGAKIMAEGTAESPIIFTSVADEIQSGQIISPNLPVTINGLWGGVIILGKAPISADAQSVQIEGIPPSDQNGLYGGTVSDDNSGIFKYVSIRHGGTDIGEGNEINGLTLGGVGSGTVIDHIEVISNVDDGIEWFGGSVNATNCLVWGQGDDAFDCDQAWTGTLDNFIYIAGPNSDHGLELDGPEGSLNGAFTLKNGILKGGTGEYGDLRSDVMVTLENIYFFNFSSSSDLEMDNNGVAQNYLDGEINFSNLQFNTSHLTEGNLTIDQIILEKTGDGETKLNVFSKKPLDASIVTTTSPTVGADKTQFSDWTLASAMGQLDEF